MVRLMVCLFAIHFGTVLQAQAQFTIRAASDQPVAGWDRMQAEDRPVWVSPTASLTSADILRAEPGRDSNGRMAVTITFTDDGARKMHDLAATQMNKIIAMILDGKVIFAPKVRSADVTRTAQLTGNSPSGLTSAQVQRILESVNKK